MDKSEQNEKTIRDYVALYNRGTIEFVDRYYAKEVEWIEMPMPATPQGRRGGLGTLLEQQEGMLTLFPDRTLRILSLVARGDTVAAELEWLGTASATIGGLKEGVAAMLRMATFFVLKDDRIVKQTDYVVPYQN